MTRIPSSLVRLSYRFHLSDLLAAILAPILAVELRELKYFTRHDLDGIMAYTLIAIGATIFSILYFRVGQILSRFLSTADILRILKAAAAAAMLTAGLAFSLMRLDGIPRSMPALHFILISGLLIGSRVLMAERYRRQDAGPRGAPGGGENVILVGANRMAWYYIRMLGCLPQPRQRIIALVDEDRRLHGRCIGGHLVAGPLTRLEALITEYAMHGVPVHRLIITDPALETEVSSLRVVEAICASRGIGLEYMTQLFHAGSSGKTVESAEETTQPAPVGRAYWRFRRALDIVAAAMMMVVLSPLFALVAVVVAMDVGTPTVFWQERVGRHGRHVAVHKFRTFKAPVDRLGEPVSEADRLSPIGRFLRATRLDELPQLYDILWGAMSLIGPRPLLPVDQPLDASIRLQARPGLTGWAQVHGGKLVTAEEKNALDEWYIAHVSVLVDLRIVCLTVLAPFRGDRRREKVIARALAFRDLRQPTAISRTASNSYTARQSDRVASYSAS